MGEGLSAQLAQAASLARQATDDAVLNAPVPNPKAFSDMEEARFYFVHRNYLADSTEALGQIRSPMLALWGEQDRNPDPSRNPVRFRQALPPQYPAEIKVLPSATHSLLDATLFDYQSTGDWPWFVQGAFLFLGREAYADGARDLITGWISDTLSEQ